MSSETKKEQDIPEGKASTPPSAAEPAESKDGIQTPAPPQKILLYLLPRESLTADKPLPSFNEVKNELVGYESLDSLPKFVYVAHSWFSDKHADDRNGAKVSILIRALRSMRKVKYVWIDYSCLDVKVDEEVKNSLALVQQIVELATRILVLPLRAGSIPVYDMRSFKSQAWCIFEACFFLKRPSRCRLIRCRPSDQADIGFAVELLSFPSKDETDEVAHLLEGFHEAQRCVEAAAPGRFARAFRPSSHITADAVYQAMLGQRRACFGDIREESEYLDRALPSWARLRREWSPSPSRVPSRGELGSNNGPSREDLDALHEGGTRAMARADSTGSSTYAPSPRPTWEDAALQQELAGSACLEHLSTVTEVVEAKTKQSDNFGPWVTGNVIAKKRKEATMWEAYLESRLHLFERVLFGLVFLAVFYLCLMRLMYPGPRLVGAGPLEKGDRLNAGEYISNCPYFWNAVYCKNSPAKGLYMDNEGNIVFFEGRSPVSAAYPYLWTSGEAAQPKKPKKKARGMFWKRLAEVVDEATHESSRAVVIPDYHMEYDAQGSLDIFKNGTVTLTILKSKIPSDMMGWPISSAS